jgi:hypothetical protein
MASGAFEPFFVHVFLMAEHHLRGILRVERQVAAADLLGKNAEGNQETGQHD